MYVVNRIVQVSIPQIDGSQKMLHRNQRNDDCQLLYGNIASLYPMVDSLFIKDWMKTSRNVLRQKHNGIHSLTLLVPGDRDDGSLS